MRLIRKLLAAYSETIIKIRYRVYRVQSWLDYQHVSALLLLWIGISLYQSPSTELDAALTTLFLPTSSRDGALCFIFFAGMLIGGQRPTLTYRIATLPLAIYGLILVWYDWRILHVLLTPAAGYGLGLWALLQLYGTRPDDDRSGGKG